MGTQKLDQKLDQVDIKQTRPQTRPFGDKSRFKLE